MQSESRSILAVGPDDGNLSPQVARKAGCLRKFIPVRMTTYSEVTQFRCIPGYFRIADKPPDRNAGPLK